MTADEEKKTKAKTETPQPSIGGLARNEGETEESGSKPANWYESRRGESKAEETAVPLRPREDAAGWEMPDWYGDAEDNAAKARAALAGVKTEKTAKAGETALETAARMGAEQKPPQPPKGLNADTRKAQAADTAAAAQGTLVESAQKAQGVREAQPAQATAARTAGKTGDAAEAETPEETAAGIAAMREKWAKDDAAEDERIRNERAARDKEWQDNYDDYANSYNPQMSALRELMERNRAESAEEAEKREKRERARKIITAATDGLRALSNLYFVNQYAPNHYNYEKDGLTPKEDEEQRAAARERAARADRRNNALLKMGDLLQGRAQGLAGLLAARDKAAEARAAADAARAKDRRERDLQPDKMRKGAADADAAASDADYKKTKAKYAPQQQEANVRKTSAEAEKARKQGSAALIRANKSGGGSGGDDAKKYYAWDSKAHGGARHEFKTAEAEENYAKREGTWHAETEVTTKQVLDKYGRVHTVTSTKEGGYPVSPEEMENLAAGKEEPQRTDYLAPLAQNLDDRGNYDAGKTMRAQGESKPEPKAKPAGKPKQPNPASKTKEKPAKIKLF